MLNRKRIAAVIAAVAFALAMQPLVVREVNAAEKNRIEMVVPYADDDPGRERLSGEVTLSEPDSIFEGAVLAAQGRAISGYSPFMGNTPYFHSDVFAGRNIVHGIDVSKYQKEIDWKAVKEAGVEYAIIRVGFRGYGVSGGMGADTYFEQNIKGALEEGIQVGVYFFSQATTVEEAVEEARYTLDKIQGYAITMPVVMDFEYAHVNGREGGRLYDAMLSKEEATKVCLAFCETIENAGYEPMLYANSSMLKNKLNPSDISDKYKVWLANYTSMTSYTGEYDFWQYSSKGAVNGIVGNVDCNFWYQENVEETPEEDTEESPESIVPVVNKLAAKAKKKAVKLSWETTDGISGYRIRRYNPETKKYERIKTIKDNSITAWKDEGLDRNTTYKYRIKAYVETDEGIRYVGKAGNTVITTTK